MNEVEPLKKSAKPKDAPRRTHRDRDQPESPATAIVPRRSPSGNNRDGGQKDVKKRVVSLSVAPSGEQ